MGTDPINSRSCRHSLPMQLIKAPLWHLTNSPSFCAAASQSSWGRRRYEDKVVNCLLNPRWCSVSTYYLCIMMKNSNKTHMFSEVRLSMEHIWRLWQVESLWRITFSEKSLLLISRRSICNIRTIVPGDITPVQSMLSPLIGSASRITRNRCGDSLKVHFGHLGYSVVQRL